MRIYYKLEVGYCGCDREGEETIPDNMSDEEINNLVNDMAMEYATEWEGDSRLCWHDDMTEEEYMEATESFYENVSGSWEVIKE